MKDGATRYRFSKEERLCSKKCIDLLFEKGHRMMVFPYSVHWMVVDDLPATVQLLVVAPKRKLHHAVDRNRAKRLTKECYRLHKPDLYAQLQKHNVKMVISVNYVHHEIFSYHTLYKKFDRIVEQIIHSVEAPL